MASSTVRPQDRSRLDDDVARRLLDSAATLAYDPATEVDWETPPDEDFHGASPEWSTLYGTPYWHELTDAQRKALTRQEAASVAGTGIWFEPRRPADLITDMSSRVKDLSRQANCY